MARETVYLVQAFKTGKGARLILSGSDLAFLMTGARSRSTMLRSIPLDEKLAAVA